MNIFEQINENAMQIIMHAGNARLKMNEAFDLLGTGDEGSINDSIQEAYVEVVEAHKVQTMVIQKYIQDVNFKSSLLFTHAQDTLMTVYSEFNMMEKMIKLYRMLVDNNN